ncbi:C-terminal processing protease CtpA/Prc, contains a PDZ domain [Lutibacter oricola]|uniref:C-terminal processing protease CtpA/Prc, contains a PDZ domain n=1 Tax=Lutibacter oricola TaxID=762486 RepID=A0A1H2XCA6_9FLAO|nr:S41 family peptidase [Lutibacter oricola]SDW90368.1 C-terminal processing protease CtpA/Prc, contains a PDZ domain [Lutibacter oricola]
MKKIIKLYISAFILIIISCCSNKNDNFTPTASLEIQDFVWKGLNTYYLWKNDVPNLNDSRFSSDKEYSDYLSDYPQPEDLFESLIYNRSTTDKWSWIVDDYIDLENSFSGISTSNGMEYGLTYEANSTTDIFGYVRYVLPNTDAANKGVKRGDVFDAINGVQLTINNYKELLSLDSYTLNFADINGGNPTSNNTSANLVKSEYQENPVYIVKTIDVDGTKIGYLMYNSFTSNYDVDLNNAFAQLKNEGATELVLDLRYNGGGDIKTAVYLSQMITGQFTGELFAKERWNDEIQEWFENNEPTYLVNNFVDRIRKYNDDDELIVDDFISSLNLTRLYVLTSGSSASASELVINGLNPYIDVVTIGTTTFGKYTGSITLYDSDDFSKDGDNFNQNHTWAMQPIVLETLNKVGENSPSGFTPTHELIDYIDLMQPLGDKSEPLLAKAISLITGASTKSKARVSSFEVRDFKNSNSFKPFGNEMYVDKKLPLSLFIK